MADGSVVIDILGNDDPIKKKLDALGGVAKTAVKGISVAVGAASAAIGALAKNALDSYANYEQLVGGVETLFGAGGMSLEEYAASVGQTVAEASGEYDKLMAAQQATLDNAAKAYQTAGMSANEYMETVTSFSAALISSLDGDTVKASQVADKAIVDMADNANKMGSSMESIQNAYQGFAKQNYTMLDNLKLGYGGTKAEMQRLLSDAEKISGQKFDLSSYADVVEAIHVVQEEMGIAGTTAKEAANTIQGSLSSMSAAWANLVTGIADENADLPDLIDQFVASAETAASNILPRLEQILSGVGQLVTSMAPIIAEHLPALVETVLPSLISAGGQMVVGLVTGLVSALPALVDALVQAVPVITNGLTQALPSLVDALVQVVSVIANGLTQALPSLVDAVVQAVPVIANGLAQAAPQLLAAGGDLLMQLVDGISQAVPNMIAALPGIIEGFLDFITEHLPEVLEQGTSMVQSMADGILEAIPELLNAVPQIIESFVSFISENLPVILDSGIDLLLSLADGIITAVPDLVAQLPQIVQNIADTLSANFPKIIQTGVNMLIKLGDGILSALPNLLGIIPQVTGSAIDLFNTMVDSVKEIGSNVIRGLWNGISDMAGWIAEKIKGFGAGVLNSLKSFFGIHSPSKVMRDQVGIYLAEGVADGIGAGAYAAEHAAVDLGNAILDTLDGMNKSLEDNQAEAATRRAQVEQEEYEAKLKEQYDEIEKLHRDTAKKIADIRAKGAKDAAKKVQDAEESAAEKEQNILDKIADIRADWEDEQIQAQEKAAQEAAKAQIDALEDLKDEYAGALEDIQKSRDSMADSLGDVDLFSATKITDTKTSYRLTDLQKSIDQIHAYGDAIAQLKERGVSDSLLDEVLGMSKEDAVSYIGQLMKLSDEQYDNYMNLWAEKESAAQEVASSIYEKQFDALKEEYLDVLPAEMRPAGEEAMASLNEGLEAGGQEAIQKAADIASAIADQFAGLDLGSVLAGLRPQAEASMARFSTGLETASNAPAEARTAYRAETNAQAAGLAALAAQGDGGRELVFNLNGTEFARIFIPYLREAEDQSPRIVSD